MARTNEKMQKIDKSVGYRIYEARLSKGFSRQQLADLIGVTHQQLQKYEKGVNRVSIGRLITICEALEVSLGYFCNGILEKPIPEMNENQRKCISLMRSFIKIKKDEHKDVVCNLSLSLANSESAYQNKIS